MRIPEQRAPAGIPWEGADVDSSSDDYATRFAGPVGRWFLEVQARCTLELLGGLPPGLRVLDVGGGHAQLAPVLIETGHEVTVLGSDPVCEQRLRPWTRAGACRFRVGNLVDLPFEDRAFDVALAFRMLPHVADWRRLVAELCRVSARSVIVDYPSSRSVNRISEPLFGLKKGIERNTRPFRLFSPREVRDAFAHQGFVASETRPQFLLPMVLYRALGSAGVARALEVPGRLTRLTRLLGSPVILRADRQG